MKCTLRKVDGGIVATIDKHCFSEDWGYHLFENRLSPPDDIEGHYTELNRVIASTIPNVGKELCIIEDGEIVQIDLYQGSRYTIAEFIESINGTKQYDYTETETQVIIEL